MIICDECGKQIEPEEDGFMSVVHAHSKHEQSPTRIETREIGERKHIALIDVVLDDDAEEFPPDCGYHYHEECFTRLLIAALTRDLRHMELRRVEQHPPRWKQLGDDGPCSDCDGDECTMNCGPVASVPHGTS